MKVDERWYLLRRKAEICQTSKIITNQLVMLSCLMLQKKEVPLWVKKSKLCLRWPKINKKRQLLHTQNLWAHIRPSPSIKPSFKIKGRNFYDVPIDQVRKRSKGELWPISSTIDINIKNTQTRACTCPQSYYPLSHKSTNEATSQ